MAEAAAAFYTVETAVEGAAVGAVAVSRPTVPIVIRFHKLKSPSPSLALSSHSLSYVKGRAYIFGGDRADGGSNNEMQILTLPTDLSLGDLDYQTVEAVAAPVRPLAEYTDVDADSANISNSPPAPRAAHAATTIGSDVFVFSGRTPSNGSVKKTPSLIDEEGTVHVFSTLSKKWTTLTPQKGPATSGIPGPRIHASITSTIHPAPQEELRTSTEFHGTLILHGGYSGDGKPLRDTWAFDVSSRIWSRWPELPRPSPDSAAGDGRVYCTESRLWRVGDSSGQMAYLEISRDIVDDFSGKSEIGITPKTGKWEVLTSGATTSNSTEKNKGPTAKADDLSVPQSRKGAGFLPVTSGAGREYLLYFLGENASSSDIWTFQIASDKLSPANVKDRIRSAVGANTGEHAWARCDVVQASKTEGELERPAALAEFAADVWSDFGGGAVIIWGGKGDGGMVKNEGWVITVD